MFTVWAITMTQEVVQGTLKCCSLQSCKTEKRVYRNSLPAVEFPARAAKVQVEYVHMQSIVYGPAMAPAEQMQTDDTYCVYENRH